MRRTLAAIVCAAAGAAALPAAAQWLPPGTAECVADIERAARAAAEDDEPLLLGDVCPQIAALINDAGWAETLLDADAMYVAAESFPAIAALAPAYDNPPAAVNLSLEALDAALDDVAARIPPQQLSLWDRALQWLQERFGRRGNFDAGWLDEWLEGLTIPERWLRVVVIVLGVLLVIATALIVLNELRAAGVFARTQARARFGVDGPALFDEAPRALNLEDVQRAPLAQQPALLLALVLARLRRKTAIADTLTHRELVAAGGRAVPEAQRSAFTTVVRAAERATFGDWQPRAQEIEPVMASGAAVLEQLSTDSDAGRAR